MPALDSKLRSTLDTVCQTARDLAVTYARLALQKRGVDAPEALPHFGPAERDLRNRLRARGRQVGDVRTADGRQSIDQLTQELAYEFWHRMLFARFLAENDLLMHPDGVAVSLEECEELAASADPPAANGFVLAARYASAMLPQIFRTDDVLLEIDFAPEQRLALEKLLASLSKETFLADDSLGWVYQFWQTAEKQRVNESGDKIDGRTLPAVTQLFTEHYMVEFLLHNTIGAWWCAKEGIQGPPGGAGIPAGKCPVDMPYLRWGDDGNPAVGRFDEWPKTLAEFTMLDPCCGSGHFLVATFNLIVPLRMHDQGLSANDACEAVLRENIFGLELDPRCTQIAAFALALAAWKYANAGGYRSLPPLKIACSGQASATNKDEWLSLANGNQKLQNGLGRLFDLFQQASIFGSLIDPNRIKANMYDAGFAELKPIISKARTGNSTEPDVYAVAVAAQGASDAAEYLSSQFTLVATNVPYLATRKQLPLLTKYLTEFFYEERFDLAIAFFSRCLSMSQTVSIVLPQAWQFLKSYEAFRRTVLQRHGVNLIARLGPEAFETISGHVVNVMLGIVSRNLPLANRYAILDVSMSAGAQEKAEQLTTTKLHAIEQLQQLHNPDAIIGADAENCMTQLQDYAVALAGILNGDTQRFRFRFWEVQELGINKWAFLQENTESSTEFGGRSAVLLWENGNGQLRAFAKEVKERLHDADKRGNEAWGKWGVAVSRMGSVTVSLYTGDLFDQNVAVILPKDPAHLNAIWRFCSSPEYAAMLYRTNPGLALSSATVAKVPFDLSHWQEQAKQLGELPKPSSRNVTNWLFTGDIADASDSLQVTVAQLLGYHWPNQNGARHTVDGMCAGDGIVALPSVRGQPMASERVIHMLKDSFCKRWTEGSLPKLFKDSGVESDTELNDWLRNDFFASHCKRFESRPFIWHIWDGRKDGFSALVNYHKLDYKTLENLTYSYLGDWINSQAKSDKAGADLRLAAAQVLQKKLKLILEGEPPYDIFVRWKTLHEQPIGWNPDLNDGVRMNIRPFVTAGILRKTPNIKWTKDRGKEPLRDKADYPWFWSGDTFVGDRVNDIHLTNAEKEAARKRRRGAS